MDRLALSGAAVGNLSAVPASIDTELVFDVVAGAMSSQDIFPQANYTSLCIPEAGSSIETWS